jgi:hypothetical protein
MTRTKTTESLISALMILLIALVLILARGDAHGCWAAEWSETSRQSTSSPFEAQPRWPSE